MLISNKMISLGVSIIALTAAASASAQPYYQAYAAPAYYANGYYNTYAPEYMTNTDVQLRLTNLGYYVGPNGANGEMNNHTIAAIRYFQSSHGIKVDGVVGPETKAALGRYAYNHVPAYRSQVAYINQGYHNGYVTRYQPVRQVYNTSYVAPAYQPVNQVYNNGYITRYQPVNQTYYTVR